MAGKWEPRSAAVASMLRDGLEDCLAVLSFPEHHRRRLASTNLLENVMKQLKRRTAVVGVFPGRASCERLIGAQLVELHESYALASARTASDRPGRWKLQKESCSPFEEDQVASSSPIQVIPLCPLCPLWFIPLFDER